MALVTHTRRIMRAGYEGTAVMDAYEAEVARRFHNGRAEFVQGLRNYTAHYDLAGSFGTMNWNPERWESKVVLDREQLLRWKRWEPRARDYLRQQGETIDFEAVIRDYTANVEGLHDWIEATLRHGHAAELAELQPLVEEHDRLVELLGRSFRE